MLPKNSRRPLTLDHKIRLKKQLAKAYKTAGIDASSGVEKRVHQNFKPKPEYKIIKRRQAEEEEREKLKEVKFVYSGCVAFYLFALGKGKYF